MCSIVHNYLYAYNITMRAPGGYMGIEKPFYASNEREIENIPFIRSEVKKHTFFALFSRDRFHR